ncbi:hypothetical protein DOM22_15870 [Bdellovibrio sp. ZAP7]|uniref:hypothetical protein n=1 Tax=Bdellovibrio sp. ZAP7 TaxID=2231053 RepID=UPI001157D184|nr:hypothetical protein [Bdellovibrio sp. ZAP7]QDK46540.1 hypothetical protein DOM22_15870 [Bdellovibrio sp. ZAP7]
MKSWIVLVSLISVTSAAVAAEIPVNLKNLLPVGRDEVSFRGTTFDRKDCSLDVFSAKKRFSAVVTVYYGIGQPDPIRTARFQLGEGYDFIGESTSAGILNFQSLHPHVNEEEKDQKATLKLYKEKGQLKAVQLLVEEEGYLGFNTLVKETCYLGKR